MKHLNLSENEMNIFRAEIKNGLIKKHRLAEWVNTNNIVDFAKKRAKNILVTAEKEKELAISDGYSRGFVDGLAKFSTEIAELKSEQITVFNKVKGEVMELTRLCTQRLLKEAGPDKYLKNIIEDAFTHMVGAEPINITCSPSNVRRIEKHIHSLFNEKFTPGAITVMGNEGMDTLSCRIITRKNVLDASVDAHLKTLINVLTKARKKTENIAFSEVG